jgi:hypothetical protein
LKTAQLTGRWVPKITREKLVEAYYEREAKSKLKAKLADPKGKSRPATTNDAITGPSKPIAKDDSGLKQTDFPRDAPSVLNRPSEAEDVLARKSKTMEPTVGLDLEAHSSEPQASPAINRSKSPMSLLKREQSEVPQQSPGSGRKKADTPPSSKGKRDSTGQQQ